MGSSDPAVFGQWEKVAYKFNHLPIHMALLKTGKVLGFGGTGNDERNLKPYPAETWDPDTGQIQSINQRLGGDVFCAGQALLPDGRVLVAGGTFKYDGGFSQGIPPFTGSEQCYIFDPVANLWSRTDDMASGRWYPTLIALGDGRVVAVAGLTKNFPWVFLRHVEVYENGVGWHKLNGADRWMPLYPRLHLLPNGDVFYSGSYNTHYTFPFTLGAFPTSSLDVANGRWKSYGMPNKSEREEGVSVLLPLEPEEEYKPKVLLAGGGTPQGKVATPAAEIIDLSTKNPKWTQVSPMSFPRYWAYATILPDRTVFVLGGRVGSKEMDMGAMLPMPTGSGQGPATDGPSHDPAAILDTELFDPKTETWTKMPPMTLDRLYHSNALLLPDGRVMAAGSNPSRRVNELRIETYKPPYFFKGRRPEINDCPDVIRYGSNIDVKTSSTRDIGAVALIRPAATTHCVNTEQRYVGLHIESTSASTIKVKVPENVNLAPPGYYMLFVVTDDNTPSTAKFVQLA